MAISLSVMLIAMWHTSTQSGAEKFEQHAYLLVRHIVKQALPSTAESIKKQQSQSLTHIIEHLSHSDFILDATVYSAKGEVLVETKNSLPLTQALGLDSEQTKLSINKHIKKEEKAEPIVTANPPSAANSETLLEESQNASPLTTPLSLIKPAAKIETSLFPIVEDVVSDGKTIGYIRVTFDYDQVQQQAKSFQEDYSELTKLMILISGLIGFLVARAFSK
nr:AhpA/YtjB family protein [Marinifaba aquimaris]